MTATTTDLYAFGRRSGPRLPRVGIDVFPDASGMIGPEDPDTAKGASAFADPTRAHLHGHYHLLPSGTALPDGFDVIADGSDVRTGNRHRPTHHTIYPMVRMHVDQFNEGFANLPWQYVGRK